MTLYRLERMELVGFKSFCERTEVKFPSGVTVVVGPNGCGKSNLGEALSWVLGEQNSRALRGERMEDVIFAGTEGRRGLGMAEVTLVLRRLAGDGNGASASAGLDSDVQAAPLPGAAADAGGSDPAPARRPRRRAAAAAGNGLGDGPAAGNGGAPSSSEGELVISRRVFRSGDSEYMMDGRRCRLRDIHERLYGTGLGTRAYSVIEQGKVDTILSGKPQERRTLIEEAAGILGYKARKRAAWLKLEATQANLLRLQDLVGEVTRQINSLKRQAARARRFRRLQEEARQRRRWLFAHRLAEAERGREDGRQALEALAGREASLASAAGRALAEGEARERVREDLRAELRAADEALASLERRHDQQEAALQHLREQQAASSGQAARLESEAAQLRMEAAALAAEAERAGGEGMTLAAEARRVAAEAAAADTEFGAALDSLEKASGRAEEERRSLFEILDRIARARTLGATLEENLRSARLRLDRLALERAQARSEAEETARALETLAARRGALQSESARVQEEIRAAGEERARAELEREHSARERAELAGRLHGLEEFRRTLARLELEENGEAAPEPLPRIADFVETDPDVEEAVEAYAEEWLGCRLVEPGALGEVLTRLKVNGPRYWAPRPVPAVPAPAAPQERLLGRLADRVRTSGPHAQALLGRLAGALLVSQGSEAIELANALPGFDLVALDGTVVTAQGVLYRRQRGAPELGLLGRRRLARQTDQECGALRQAAADLEARAAGVARTAQETGSRERAASERAAALNRELASLAAREGEAAIGRQRYTERERLLEAEASVLAAEIAEWEREAERAREELQAGEDLRRSLEASAEAAQAEAERRREDLKALHARLEVGRARQAEADRQRAVQVQKAEALGRRVAELAERAAALETRARAGREAAGAFEGRIGEAQGALRVVLEERAHKDAARSSLEQRIEDLRLAAETGQETARRLHQELEEVRAAAREREVALARADSDWEHLRHECRQELDMEPEQVRPAPGESLPEREALERELEELRRDLDRLGPVNLLALEEYQELEQRHAFLSGQHQDLQSSVESLKQTIQRLNRRSREQFVEAFEQIRGNFHDLFRLLFGGGRAEIKLEEGEDVLECGLEVNVQPPGKRLHSIQLLSGGEKALAALALLFSIFRYKPSPFCLLDEVDAALDESNIERFLRIVRDFQQNTQFVLITHNKRSMEIGDLLYGVTMEEPGVSKLVSVDLT
jgi:chromosome segregation protein